MNRAVVIASLILGVGGLIAAMASKRSTLSKATEPDGPSSPATFGGLPGAPAFTDDLKSKLQRSWESRTPSYKPRTRHLRPDGAPKYTNRLFLESSPYLRQHAHNPVNWYPWGDEAFEAARRLGRPVLLSIGYSTCHWCHVMEEESFEDEEVALYMNEHYVSIKVDREERPDVDAIYMAAVQALTGQGGWPMTVWLTSDRKPFYGGTYFPARDGDRGARVGFLSMLRQLQSIYSANPERIAQSSAQIVEAIQRQMVPEASASLPSASVLDDAAVQYRSRFDETYGGLRGAPKFPSSLPVRFLLRHHLRTGNAASLKMATLTLDQMAKGGIYDHVGGGFHRYSTDGQWLVPHFEKMLYDNALLAVAYLEGYQATHREDFADVAREILRYVARDMTSPDGAFYSATDADSVNPSGHREEGWFFTWTPTEIVAALGEQQARAVSAYYGISAHGDFEGRSILHVARPLADVARELRVTDASLRTTLHEARETLYAARSKRPAPQRDEKILTAWNGLMISAHAKAALVLSDRVYAERAERAASFILKTLRKDGRLLRSYKDGQGRHAAYLDDYAFLIAGLLDLYEATGNQRWLQDAIALDGVLDSHYADKSAGGYFMTSDDHEKLLAREKPSYDGAEPSGNSVQVLNLLRISELTTEDAYRQRAERALGTFGAILTSSPSALSEMLLAVDFFVEVPKEIVLVTPSDRSAAEPLLAKLRSVFLPNHVLVVVAEGSEVTALQRLVPLVEGRIAQRGKPTAYVCERGICELPTTDPEVFAKLLGTKAGHGKTKR